jgi:hypothetical protein
MDNSASNFDFLLEYLHLSLANGGGKAELQPWFDWYEAAPQAWQVEECHRLWRLLASQPLSQLTQARARMMRGLLWANLGD